MYIGYWTLNKDCYHLLLLNPCSSYQSGQLFGAANNQKEKVATRIQAFMISSIKSKKEDVVSLVSSCQDDRTVFA